MSTYQYTPLPDSNHLRLLNIEKPYLGSGDEIQCCMLTASISGGPDYAALSYSWGMDQTGDASICERIIIDGQAVGVTRNLLHGLRRIFVPLDNNGDDEYYPIWVDAVCIDQSNVAERNAQVAKMAEIYSCASKVFVWLGEDSSSNPGDSISIAAALDCLLQSTHQHYHEHVVMTPRGKTARLCLAHAGIASATALISLRTSGTKLPPDDFPTCLPRRIQHLFNPEEVSIAINELQRLFMLFLTKRYWSRRWVIQEMFHAEHNEVYILYAGKVTGIYPLRKAFGRIFARLGWSDVETALNMKLSLDLRDQDLRASIDRVTNMLGLRHSVAMFGKHILASSMHISNGYDCQDPRDRLYALLSIDPETRIQADYRLNADEVYVNFCADLLRDEGLLPDLVYAAASQKTKSAYDDAINASLPSWCVDLRDNFGDLRRDVTLGPCTVANKQLSCSVLAVGLYPRDGQIADIVVSGSDERSRRARPCRILYTYSSKCSPGDLLCTFRHAASSSSTTTMPTIILKARNESCSTYEIVGLCLSQWDSWYPEDYNLRNVVIS